MGFFEAALSSILATLVFDFFFLPPIGTFTIADPEVVTNLNMHPIHKKAPTAIGA